MEGWTRQIDIYCERLGPGLWAEPVNAVSNAAFLIAAWIMWRRVHGRGLGLLELLCALLAAIGIGSTLWHTFATPWASLSDVLAIVLFILAYLYAINRQVWGMTPARAGFATAAFVPYAALTGTAFAAMPFFKISGPYWTVTLLIALYAAALWGRSRETARGLAIGAALLTLSLTFRSIDEGVCSAIPLGTHFIWHLLNGVLLGWMIEVLRHDALASRAGAAP